MLLGCLVEHVSEFIDIGRDVFGDRLLEFLWISWAPVYGYSRLVRLWNDGLYESMPVSLVLLLCQGSELKWSMVACGDGREVLRFRN